MTSYIKMVNVHEKAMGLKSIGNGNPDSNLESLCSRALRAVPPQKKKVEQWLQVHCGRDGG
jgi:hypothetical protein